MRAVNLAILIAASFWVVAGPAVAADRSAASVVKVSGAVRINGRPAQVGAVVRQGDRVETETSDQSYVDVRFSIDRVLRLKSGKMTLTRLTDQVVIGLDLGKTFVQAGPMTGRQTFRIHTPSAVAGVRGTKFFLATGAAETYICVCEGKVWAKKRGLMATAAKEMVVSAGEDAHIRPKEKLSAPVESPMMVKMTWDEFADMGFPKSEK